MKHATLVLLMFVLWVAGCASQETRVQLEPRTYDEAMRMIANELVLVDEHLNLSQYPQAVDQAERAVRHSTYLATNEPPRSANVYDDYVEYRGQVDDLIHATNRLQFMLEQRRTHDAQFMLEEAARRFNRLSTNYGPSHQIGVLSRHASEFRFEESGRRDLPGELRYDR